MSGYRVLSPTKSGWRLSAQEFVALLLNEWPHAHARAIPDNRPLTGIEARLRLEPPESSVTELIFNDEYGDGVYMETVGEVAVQIAVWFRALAPAEQTLWFCDEHFNKHIEIPAGVTAGALYRLWDDRLVDNPEMLERLAFFAEREGHTHVPESHVEADRYLGSWVSRIRWLQQQGWLSDEQRILFAAIAYWEW